MNDEPTIRPMPQRRKGGSEPKGSLHDRSDAVLFQRFLEGDDTSFMELFHRHTPRLHAYCAKIVGDPESAHDILQDVWERMARYRTLDREAPGSPLGLLIRITRNLSLNFKRDRKEKITFDELPSHLTPSVRIDGMSEMEEAAIIGLEKLPEHQKELLVLLNYSGYSYEEIAEMYGETIGAIRNRAWRACMKLGRIIAALIDMQDGDEGDEGREEIV